MKIAEMFGKNKTVFSLEVFPPKKTAPIEKVYSAVEELCEISPDAISVTFGAGGSEATRASVELAGTIRSRFNIEPMLHLTCISQTRDEADEILKTARGLGIENILALRGDITPDHPRKNDFTYASDLVSFVRERGFSVAGACYPEGHSESPDIVTDVLNLRHKVDCGASHLVSQLFFDNAFFYDFLERARLAGINVPIEAGIMPVTNKNQIERMVTLCGASLPPKFAKMMQRYENNPDALRDAGIAYAVDQIVDLVSHGVDGIHLYTMNNPYIAKRIYASIESIIRA